MTSQVCSTPGEQSSFHESDLAVQINGFNENHTHSGQYESRSPYLPPTPAHELHDLLCVGFGPASLAIAIALYDRLESDIKSTGRRLPKVGFLERQPKFAWHVGMLLEGTKMQITFIKDMATLRNPRSSFTFLNYLHTKDRLIQFSNLDTFLPQRIEYEDYLEWCASHFGDAVSYNQEVLEVRPEISHHGDHRVDSFSVVSKHLETDEMTTRRARHVVIAVGGRPTIPSPFPERHPRVIHSSEYSYRIKKILNDNQAPYKIAVIGSGQSAAEIFSNILSEYPNSNTRLIIKGAALRPSDDSPFVNEVFDPNCVSQFYSQPPSMRVLINSENRSTNYGVVRLELLEHIYQKLYLQRLRHGNEGNWAHRILSNSIVVRFDSGPADIPILHIAQNNPDDSKSNDLEVEAQEFDAVILGTGYTRDRHEDLLESARYLLPSGTEAHRKWMVSRDYKVMFEKDMVSPNAGVWLQGCNEDTHGLADSLLSILAVRGGEIVESIFGGRYPDQDQHHEPNGVNGAINNGS